MSGAQRPFAVAICGPTASGKSEAAVLVAEALGGEIINADSRQVYRDLRVGTGWPGAQLMERVPHHLYGFVDPCERYSAGAYVDEAIAVVDSVAARGRLPLIVGGTGLYVEALAGSMPLDRPIADEAVRDRVHREARIHDHEFLREWLDVAAPNASKRVARGDRYRTLRSLEAALIVRTQSSARSGRPKATPTLDLLVFILSVEAAELARRITARVHSMYDDGLAQEALAVWRRCAWAPALTGLGYREVLAWQRGEMTRDEAIRNTVTRTLRYAKRQRTWFRRMRGAASVVAASPIAAATTIGSLARERASAT